MRDEDSERGTDADTGDEVGPERGLDDEAAEECAETREERAQVREERAMTDEERAELYRQQLKELRLLDIARDMMLTVVTVGYQKLGLTEETRELRDLDDARLAIELLRAVVEAVEGSVPAEEIETYRSTLAQMQLNYARVTAG